ncbi:odorant/gustatory chemosensory receptor-like 122 [Plakobranchus ocellatus]|uniref:Odorant/gustatory chemosensory receptor-like 122 n=1 Tax=Plakobranchus ocellatus TaxID=259542 RepID=A0AAV4AA32_9GAST|nr:odorant/gustatory chemosensory receptor-like 122 [Plakobranchus ocellatus]
MSDGMMEDSRKPPAEKNETHDRKNRACTSIRNSLSPVITWMKLFGLYHENVRACLDTVTAVNEVSGAKHNQVQDAWLPNTGLRQSTQGDSVIQNDPAPGWSNRPAIGRMLQMLKAISLWRVYRAGSRNLRFGLHRFYCVLVTALLVINFFKTFLAVFQESGFGLGYRVVMLLWYVHTTFGTVFLLYSCWRRTYFQSFFKEWMELFSDQKTMQVGFTTTSCCKCVMAFTVGSIIVLFVNVFTLASALFVDDIPISNYQRELSCQPFPVRWWSLALAMLVHVYNSAAWTLACGFTACLAHFMAEQFKGLSNLIRSQDGEIPQVSVRMVSSHWSVSGWRDHTGQCPGDEITLISKANGQIPANISGLRMCHLRMCKLLDTLNRFFRLYLAVNLSSSIACSTFILYQIVIVRADEWSLAANMFWFAGSVLAVMSTSISLSMLHEAAHAPLEELFAINSGSADTAHVIQLQLFLSKLTGTTIGATVLDLFVVTKEVLITLGLLRPGESKGGEKSNGKLPHYVVCQEQSGPYSWFPDA